MEKDQFARYFESNTDNNFVAVAEAFNIDIKVIIFLNLVRLVPSRNNKVDYYQSSFFSIGNTIEEALDNMVFNIKKENPKQATEEEINIIGDISNKKEPIWKFISKENLEINLTNH
ncbi:hypothetical protein [Gluconobacter cerinus]|uniref:Uncharacterized protein n=1 Tax=Gluconobacter cerinus TaxID=38307 RepID=A0AAV5NJ28_9PROT|nr:hypothetical protein [Gluconobacter cerinus]GBQ94500.1 hypothetical protein AA0229_0024 [Gluconobacter cerinus NRIC 0229]GLQ64296.1 hypothetical protein GCM10007867_31430 [Gluconobacter cerinus]